MIFWTEGNAADDDTNFAMGLKEHTDDVAAALRALKEGALQKDAL